MTETIRADKINRVGLITLNRPEKLNALNSSMFEQLHSRLLESFDDDSIDTIAITGAGRAFSAGGDLEEELSLQSARMGGYEAYIDRFQLRSPMQTLLASPKPTIAVVNGLACAAGLGLVLACDIAIAGESASFSAPEGRVGLYDHYIPTLLKWKVGRTAALYFMLTGDIIDATTAYEWGVVSRVVQDEELLAAAFGVAASITAVAPQARSYFREAILADAPLINDPRASNRSASSIEGQEGIRAFLEKRPPSWVPPEGLADDQG